MNRRKLIQRLSSVFNAAMINPTSTVQGMLAQEVGCSPAQQHTSTETGFLISQCSQQSIQVTLQRTIRIQDCQRPDGSHSFRISNRIHGTGEGYELGTGKPTGTHYILNERNFSYDLSYPSTQNECVPDSVTYRERAVLISQGGAPNEKVFITETFSIDSSCQFSSGSNIESDCGG